MSARSLARCIVLFFVVFAAPACSTQGTLLLDLIPPALVNLPHEVSIDTAQVFSQAAGQTLRFDLYRPRDAAGPLPLVVVVHGGSWYAGSRDDMAAFAYDLAAHGYAAASIDYRLANGDSVVFPMPVADVLTAVRFLRENAAALNLDPGRIALLGRSAGAHLVLLAGLTADTAQFDPSRPAGETAGVRAVVDLFGPADLTVDPSTAKLFQIQIVENFLGQPLAQLDPAVLARASPIRAVRAAGPPVLVIHGDADNIVPVAQARLLRDALAAAGEPVEYHEIPFMDHLPGGFWPGPFVQEYRGFIFAFLAANL